MWHHFAINFTFDTAKILWQLLDLTIESLRFKKSAITKKNYWYPVCHSWPHLIYSAMIFIYLFFVNFLNLFFDFNPFRRLVRF